MSTPFTAPHFGLLLLAILGTAVARADKWMPPGDETTKYKLGALECVQEQRNPKHALFPEYAFSCSRDGKQLFRREGYGAEVIKASPDQKFIVGISNSGLHPFAYWAIDSEGKTIVEQKHRHDPAFYCEASVSLVRTWFDKSAPNIRFFEIGGRLVDVAVNGCHGEVLSLNALTPFAPKLSAEENEAYKKQLRDWNAAEKRSFAERARLVQESDRVLDMADQLERESAKGNLAEVTRLLDEGANPNGSLRGQPPLVAAAEDDRAEVVKLLLARGADVNITRQSGETAISLAAYVGSLDVTKVLVAAGANLELPEKRWNWTPLMRAANRGHMEVVKLLVGAGANYRSKDKDGKTAADHARDNGHSEITKYLTGIASTGNH